MNLNEFLESYDPKGTRTIQLNPSRVDYDEQGQVSPFFAVTSKHGTLILNPMVFDDHLCIDVHAFDENGDDARTGVFGMEEGMTGRSSFHATNPSTLGTSHSWPATRLVALLLGKQEEEAS